MNPLADLIRDIKIRQAEISQSLAAGNAATWETYQRTVGMYLGLEQTLKMIESILKDEDEDE
jgi:hypothetical protein